MNNKLPLQTPNLTAQNIDKIAALFPQLHHGNAGRGEKHP